MATIAPPTRFGTRLFVDYNQLAIEENKWVRNIPSAATERKLSSQVAVLSLESGPSQTLLGQRGCEATSSSATLLQCALEQQKSAIGFLDTDRSSAVSLRVVLIESPNVFRGKALQTKRARLAALEKQFASIWNRAQDQFRPKTIKYFSAALILEHATAEAYPALRPCLGPSANQQAALLVGPRAVSEPPWDIAEHSVLLPRPIQVSSAVASSGQLPPAEQDEQGAAEYLTLSVSNNVMAKDVHPRVAQRLPALCSSAVGQSAETGAMDSKLPHLGLQSIHFVVRCDENVHRRIEATAGRWNLFVIGNATELGSWNLNVARKLEFSAQERVFRTTVPLFSTAAAHQQAIRYVYFFLDDRLNDRCATGIFFETAERAAYLARNSDQTSDDLLLSPNPDTGLDWPRSRAVYPRLHSLLSADATNVVHVQDCIYAVQSPGGRVRFRVRVVEPSKESTTERIARKLYITGDVYQLGLWTQPGLIPLQPSPSEPNVWELSIARPPWDNVEYIFAVDAGAGAGIQYECAITRFRELVDDSSEVDCYATWEDEVYLPSPVPSWAIKGLSALPAITVGPFFPATELRAGLTAVAGITGRSPGLVIVFLPHERFHCTSPTEREQLQTNASRLGVHLLPLSLQSNRLLTTVDWVLAPEVLISPAEREALEKAMVLAETVLRRGSAVYLTSAGSYRVLATFLAALWYRMTSVGQNESMERFHDLLDGVRREMGLVGLASYSLWRFLVRVTLR